VTSTGKQIVTTLLIFNLKIENTMSEKIKEKLQNEKVLTELEKLIKQNKGAIAPEEAVVNTGYSKDEVMTAFDRLLELYESKVILNQNTGALQFQFKYPL